MRIDLLREYIKEDPGDPFLRYALGLELLKTGKEEEALEQFLIVRDRFSEYLPNYYQLGDLMIRTGRSDEGLSVLKDGIELARRQGDDHTAGELRSLLEEYSTDL
jgi:tetratricopeptide (TPR) repeat protein